MVHSMGTLYGSTPWVHSNLCKRLSRAREDIYSSIRPDLDPLLESIRRPLDGMVLDPLLEGIALNAFLW